MGEVLLLLTGGDGGWVMKSTFLIQTFCWKQRAVRQRICAITQGSHFQSNYHITSEQTA